MKATTGKKSGYDQVVDFNRSISTFFGIWPENPLNLLTFIKFFTPFFAQIILYLPQTYKLWQVMDNFNDLIEVLTTAWLIVGVTWLKLGTTLSKRRELTHLLDEMKRDWKTSDEWKLKIMWKEVRLVRFMVRFSVYSASGSAIPLFASRLVMNHFYNKQLWPLSSDFPESMRAYESPRYEILWTLQLAACFVVPSAFANFDGYFIFTIFHLCAQIRILRRDIRALVSESRKSRRDGSYFSLMRLVVQRHLKLKGFANLLEESFNRVFLLQMIVFSLTICLQGYQVLVTFGGDLQRNLPSVIFICLYTIANVFSLFIYCLVGEKLRTESSKIFDEAYNTEWYDLKPKEAKTLVVIMCASKYPLEITAGKFTALSLEYFASVLKTAMGYCSMLFVVKDKIA